MVSVKVEVSEQFMFCPGGALPLRRVVWGSDGLPMVFHMPGIDMQSFWPQNLLPNAPASIFLSAKFHLWTQKKPKFLALRAIFLD